MNPHPDIPFSSFTPEHLHDYRIDAATLAQLAQSRPDLWPGIRQHPNCDPQLRTWIDQRLAQAPPQPPMPPNQPIPPELPNPDEWARRFEAANGREPSMSEYRTAEMNGEIAQERRRVDPNMQQMADGAKQFATGAKDFFTNRAAPAAVGAARNVAGSVREQAGQARGSGGWRSWVPVALPGFAVLGIIATFFPVAVTSASGFGFDLSHSQWFYDEEAEGIGWWLLLFLLATAVLGILSLVRGAKWARIAAGVVGTLTGVFTSFMGFGMLAAMSDVGGSSMGVSVSATPGLGTILLTLASIGILAAGILTLVSLRWMPR